ncbi:MAG: hypothetical protein AABZ10_11880, partial [Nitrospirota bacterium]
LVGVMLFSFAVAATPSASAIDAPPSLMLLGAGARWAAGEGGGTALYVNWQDNLFLHPNPYGPPYAEPNPGDSISRILKKNGLQVEFAGDVPTDLNKYAVVVVTAYWAVEPVHESLFREYAANGGGVVLVAGVPVFFETYCKDFWCDTWYLPNVQEWFGAGWYANTEGTARATVDNPFGTSLKAGDVVAECPEGSCAAVYSLAVGAEEIARWDDGNTFAFRYEPAGRVYYQAKVDDLALPLQAKLDIDPDTINLKSKGRWITAYIELPEGFAPGDVAVSSILLNGQVPASLQPVGMDDCDNDGVAELMVKFDRQAVQEILPEGNQVELTVTGKVAGLDFMATDPVSVIRGGN